MGATKRQNRTLNGMKCQFLMGEDRSNTGSNKRFYWKILGICYNWRLACRLGVPSFCLGLCGSHSQNAAFCAFRVDLLGGLLVCLSSCTPLCLEVAVCFSHPPTTTRHVKSTPAPTRWLACVWNTSCTQMRCRAANYVRHNVYT